MTANLIDGKVCAAQVKEQVSQNVQALKVAHNVTPGLAVILVGNDSASEVYVRSKKKQTLEVGMKSAEYALGEDTSEVELINLIEELNADSEIHGILVQLPILIKRSKSCY